MISGYTRLKATVVIWLAAIGTILLVAYTWGFYPFQNTILIIDNSYVRSTFVLVQANKRGYMGQVFVQEGERVKVGDRLVEIIDPSIYKQWVQNKHTFHKLSKRLAILAEGDHTAPEYMLLREKLDKLTNQLNSWRASDLIHTVYSYIDAIVKENTLDSGSYIGSNEFMLSLEPVGLWVAANVDINYLESLEIGQRASVYFKEDLGSRAYLAVVRSIGNSCQIAFSVNQAYASMASLKKRCIINIQLLEPNLNLDMLLKYKIKHILIHTSSNLLPK